MEYLQPSVVLSASNWNDCEDLKENAASFDPLSSIETTLILKNIDLDSIGRSWPTSIKCWNFTLRVELPDRTPTKISVQNITSNIKAGIESLS